MYMYMCTLHVYDVFTYHIIWYVYHKLQTLFLLIQAHHFYCLKNNGPLAGLYLEDGRKKHACIFFKYRNQLFCILMTILIFRGQGYNFIMLRHLYRHPHIKILPKGYSRYDEAKPITIYKPPSKP